MNKLYDVVALCSAAVDIQMPSHDERLSSFGLKKGLSNSVTAEQQAAILNNQSFAQSPGSAGGNVAMGIALHNGKSGLIGKVANDNAGAFFTERVQSHGVNFMPSLCDDLPTTSILVLTTPDAERTFAVVNGAGSALSPEDVDAGLISAAKITYIDSYLWATNQGEETIRHSAQLAKLSEGRLAIALNDVNITRQYRDKIMSLICDSSSILVGDEKELQALLNTSNAEETTKAILSLGCTAAFTQGKNGAYVTDGSHGFFHVPAHKVDNVIDTSGAGDQFAAGFLYGLAQGKTVVASAQMGTDWAAAVIQHMGAEPQTQKNLPASSQNQPRPTPSRHP